MSQNNNFITILSNQLYLSQLYIMFIILQNYFLIDNFLLIINIYSLLVHVLFYLCVCILNFVG